jgi:RNA polymerase sigma-70 factor, ECF subfamily
MSPDIRGIYERCQKRFPTLDLPFADYATRFGEVLKSSHVVSLHDEDLFLAMACARGDRIAWEHFADEFLPALQRFALQACRSTPEGEDLAQELFRSLMADSRKIAGYDGRGSLLSWLRVAVSRAAIDRFRRGQRQVPLEEAEEAADANPALSVPPQAGQDLDERWGAIMVDILVAEIRRLPARDRLLLGIYYVEGVPLRGVAAHFGVHESTASRWMDGLRHRLRKGVEREFRVRHGMRSTEVDALWEAAAREPDHRLRDAMGSQGAVCASGGADPGGK